MHLSKNDVICFDFRISLPYAAGLLLLQFCMKHFNDFAIIDIPSLDHQTCAGNMWRNLFYIDQFYPLDERVGFLLSRGPTLTDEETNQIISLFLSVHDLVVDSIAWNAVFRCRLHHFVDIEKPSALRHCDFLFISDRFVFCNDRTSISRSPSTPKIEFKVNCLLLFRIHNPTILFR